MYSKLRISLHENFNYHSVVSPFSELTFQKALIKYLPTRNLIFLEFPSHVSRKRDPKNESEDRDYKITSDPYVS